MGRLIRSDANGVDAGEAQRLSLWELLVLTVNKTVARTSDLRTDLRALQVEVEKAAEASALAQERAADAADKAENHMQEDGAGHNYAAKDAAEAAAAEVEAVKRVTAAEAAVAPKAEAAAQAEEQLRELLLHVYRGFAGMLTDEVMTAGAENSDEAMEGAERR
jgi:hypothetical protein